MLRPDRRADAAARRHLAEHLKRFRCEQCNQIIQDAVGQVLVEDPDIAKREQIILQRSHLDAFLVGHVRNRQLAEMTLERVKMIELEKKRYR